MVDFHVVCQIMDCPLKLMKICLRTLGLFMALHDETQISVSSTVF
jgi:hypothetical protein